jgi:hypothetical protein
MSWFVTMFVTSGLSLSSEGSLILKLVVNIAASGTALIVILRTFRRARYTAEISNLVIDRRWAGPFGYRVMMPMWTGAYAVAILTVTFFRAEAAPVILAVFVVLVAYLCYALRLSFPLRLPLEGIVALSALALTVAGSIVLLAYGGGDAGYAILWGSTIVIWLLAAAYARRRPLPEPVEDSAT